MKLNDALQGVNKVFLDTSPIVYYVESVPTFFEIARLVFTWTEVTGCFTGGNCHHF